MANTKNLRDVSKLPPEEHKAISSRGGIQSGKSRAAIKTMREYVRSLGEEQVIVDTGDEGEAQEMSRIAAVVYAQYAKAINKGDTQAATFIATMLDEMKQQTQVVNPNFVIQVGDKALAGELAKAMKED